LETSLEKRHVTIHSSFFRAFLEEVGAGTADVGFAARIDALVSLGSPSDLLLTAIAANWFLFSTSINFLLGLGVS
jgi:hypothetical protein